MPSFSWRLPSRALRAFFILSVLPAVVAPASALPEFARRYGVGCGTCHSVPPRLNTFGLAFQANHFNWPGEMKLARKSGLQGLPLSAIGTASFLDDFTSDTRDTDFRNLLILASDGFRLGRTGNGGYFVNAIAATNQSGEQAGNLLDAFAALQVAGRTGQLALVAGQFTPMLYQYDPVNSLMSAQPAALGISSDAFSFLTPAPGLRLDWFDNRGKGTADGNYISIGAPFGGSLALNHTSRWDGGHGVTAHAFRRKGLSSAGVFGYTRAGNHLLGVMLTQDVAANLHLLGVGELGHDLSGSSRSLSLQAEYTHNQSIALTGRLDVIKQPAGAASSGGGGGYRSSRALGDDDTDVGFAAAITYYPLKIHALRLSAELVERRANRMFTLFVRGQL